MSTDHNRPLPVAPERLEAVGKMLYPLGGWSNPSKIAHVYTVALLGEQVEQSQQLAFFLQEAHDIYNQRWR